MMDPLHPGPDVDPFFEELGAPLLRGHGARHGRTWLPPVTIAAQQSRLIVRVELPGVKGEEIAVTAGDRHIRIEGETKREVSRETSGLRVTELRADAFARTVPMPEGAAIQEMTLAFGGGVLDIVVPLRATAAKTVPGPVVAAEAPPAA